MEKKPMKIKLEDIPDDLSQLEEDTEIVIDEHDPMMDDAFWENI